MTVAVREALPLPVRLLVHLLAHVLVSAAGAVTSQSQGRGGSATHRVRTMHLVDVYNFRGSIVLLRYCPMRFLLKNV